MMLNVLWLVPALPLLSAAFLLLLGERIPRRAVALVGVGTIGISTLLSIIMGLELRALPAGDVSAVRAYSQVLWGWMDVRLLSVPIGLYLDPLSLVMMLVVTGVGFLIHLYSVEYMAGDDGFSRFFGYMNLFVASMLTLVLADNLLLLYLGWEGVGLCSYLLIGFWYKDAANGRAARKAFIVTRVGDAAMAVGLFILFTELGTLNIQPLLHQAVRVWPMGSAVAAWTCALLLGGAVGKSAQLPLQTWLPDAMAGPTPVSALIHAATMVTAGVYLIARMHTLFELAPSVQHWVAGIGAATLLVAGLSALTQSDIKRVLAYSTMSQVGYMFLALGVGAWSAAIFHFMTHAFFKALLFLSAGVVILSLHHEQDIFRMGGLRTRLPLVFWTFVIGVASLSALPWVTAGFFSKELILARAYAGEMGSTWLWLAGVVGAFLTSLYGFRLLFIVFFGEFSGDPAHAEVTRPRAFVGIPLVVLAFLSVAGGWPEALFLRFLQPVFFVPGMPEAHAAEGSQPHWLGRVAILASLAGLYFAYLMYLRRSEGMEAVLYRWHRARFGRRVERFLTGGWGFDWLYDRLWVKPLLWFANVNRRDFLDRIFDGVAGLSAWIHRLLSATQSGRLRRYAMSIGWGAVLILGLSLVFGVLT